MTYPTNFQLEWISLLQEQIAYLKLHTCLNSSLTVLLSPGPSWFLLGLQLSQFTFTQLFKKKSLSFWGSLIYKNVQKEGDVSPRALFLLNKC